MEKKRSRVFRVETDKAESGCLIIKHDSIFRVNPEYQTQSWLAHIDIKSYHVYFTTDEKIEAGDWYYSRVLKGVFKNEFESSIERTDNRYRRIVSSTDRTLIYKCDCCDGTGIIEEEPCRTCVGGVLGRVPQPSMESMNMYCEERGPDEVDIEYEIIWSNPCKEECLETKGLEGTPHEGISVCDDGCVRSRPKPRPKVDEVNGRTTIHKLRVYTHEEAVAFLHAAKKAYHEKEDGTDEVFDLDRWIRENL